MASFFQSGYGMDYLILEKSDVSQMDRPAQRMNLRTDGGGQRAYFHEIFYMPKKTHVKKDCGLTSDVAAVTKSNSDARRVDMPAICFHVYVFGIRRIRTSDAYNSLPLRCRIGLGVNFHGCNGACYTHEIQYFPVYSM